MKETVFKSILNPPKNRFGYSIEVDFDEFAEELKRDFPNEVKEFYWQKAYRNIPVGTEKHIGPRPGIWRKRKASTSIS
jgi:hypothetical protein